jgi:hypothetical protein
LWDGPAAPRSNGAALIFWFFCIKAKEQAKKTKLPQSGIVFTPLYPLLCIHIRTLSLIAIYLQGSKLVNLLPLIQST